MVHFRWRPAVEMLEDRLAPATFTVTDPADNAATADPFGTRSTISTPGLMPRQYHQFRRGIEPRTIALSSELRHRAGYDRSPGRGPAS